ncbi:unnamed protein product [Symbiodinium microadriaticum]|nr:unnamed protein product [Symbiodinium microadriaticum]CAE7768890.1 unnamed protein product [Symbiodinium sp. KB8]
MPRSLASSETEESYGPSSSIARSEDETDNADSSASGGDANMALRSDDEVFQASDSEAAPAPELSCRSPLPRSTALAEREHHFQLKRQSFVEGSSSKASAQLREYRKGHGRDPSRTLLYNVSEYLSPERRGDLEHMSAALRCMLEEDMLANDLEWLERLPEGPMPDRLVAMQFFQRAIYASLLEQAGAADGGMVAHLSVELTSNTFYRPAMRLLWPLLSSKQQLEVQQWFFCLSAHMDEQPRGVLGGRQPGHDPVGESDIGQALLLFLLFPLNQADFDAPYPKPTRLLLATEQSTGETEELSLRWLKRGYVIGF